MSLRWRLVVGLVGVVLAGLLAAYAATYVVVKSFLYDRVDEQLVQATSPVLARIGRPVGNPLEGRPGPRGGPPSYVPPGTYGEIRRPDGVTNSGVFELDSAYAAPRLPTTIALPAAGQKTFDADATDGSLRYRVRASALGDGSVLVVAMPLTGLDQTLRDIRMTGLVVSGAVVLVLGALAYWLVRLALRPLDHMTAEAGAIAAGTLTHRIAHTDSRTEAGRLGAALNQMLGRLEHAFAEQKASEEQLRRFLADASHELRTPLTSIRGYAELFRRGASDRPEDLAKVMRRVDEESARMSVLVDDLLLLARLNQGRPLERAPVDLASLARDAVDDASVVAPGRRIALESAGPVIVQGDEGRLRQVIANLVTNAVHHTPPEAPVTVYVGVREGGVRMEVADRGPGLSPTDAAHVFEPFYRIDRGRVRSKGGTGLGLAIVKAIVEAHGGRIGVRANEPQGSVFEVSLPG